MNPTIQSALLKIYRRVGDMGILSNGPGRWLFEATYLTYKSLEAGPVDRLASYVTPGSWVIDVGANIGFFTRRFARWVGKSGGRVLAIEPEDHNLERLKYWLGRNHLGDRVEVLPVAAAERDGTLFLAINPHHPGDHHLAKSGVPVRVTTLDTLIRERDGPSVSLIKIDVQGAEHRVLMGATEILRRDHPALFVEMDERRLQENGSSVIGVAAFLGTFGYSPFRMDRSGAAPVRDLATEAACWRGRDSYGDILFLPQTPDSSLSSGSSPAACSFAVRESRPPNP